MKNNDESFRVENLDVVNASFQLLIEAVARLRMLSDEISLIRIATLNGICDLQENVDKEKLQVCDTLKTKQYELLADLMNRYPRQTGSDEQAIELQKTMMEFLSKLFQSFQGSADKKDDSPVYPESLKE